MMFRKIWFLPHENSWSFPLDGDEPAFDGRSFAQACVRCCGSTEAALKALKYLGVSERHMTAWLDGERRPLPAIHRVLRAALKRNQKSHGKVSLYSLVTPEGFFLTAPDAANHHNVSDNMAYNKAYRGSDGWFLVPYGCAPTPPRKSRERVA